MGILESNYASYINAEMNAVAEYILNLNGIVPNYENQFNVGYSGSDLTIQTGALLYKGKKAYTEEEETVFVNPESVGTATRYITVTLMGGTSSSFTFGVSNTSQGNILNKTVDLMDDLDGTVTFDFGTVINTTSGIQIGSFTSLVPVLNIYDLEQINNKVNKTGDTMTGALNFVIGGVIGIYKRVVRTLANLGAITPTTLQQIHNFLPEGGSFEGVVSVAAFNETQLPSIVIEDNYNIIVKVNKVSASTSEVTIKQIGTEALTFETIYTGVSWNKYKWEHVAGKRTLYDGTTLNDGTTFTCNSIGWIGCDILYSVDKWDDVQTSGDGSKLFLFTGYGVNSHTTVAGDITNWNNTSNKTLTLKRLTHNASGNHLGAVSTGVNKIMGTYYKEVQP